MFNKLAQWLTQIQMHLYTPLQYLGSFSYSLPFGMCVRNSGGSSMFPEVELFSEPGIANCFDH